MLKIAAAAILKIRKTATRRPILTTFSTMMSLGLPATVCQRNFTNLKINSRWWRLPLEKFRDYNIFVTD